MPARILVIEDNPDNLELMIYLLRAFGHEILSARDGEEGLTLARREQFDLIVCDVQMPKMDGYEVASHLKNDLALRKVPLIAVTALAMVGDRDRVLSAGFDGYVAKPIDAEGFVPHLEGFLQPDQRTKSMDRTASHGSAVTPTARNRRILVVDNLPVNLELARGILEPFGYKVLTAEGITEGLALARQIVPDLILSDVCMNDGSGYDFIQAVKAEPQLCGIPFVFLTSTMLDEADRARALALGAKKYLCRPIEPQVLLAELAACMLPKQD